MHAQAGTHFSGVSWILRVCKRVVSKSFIDMKNSRRRRRQHVCCYEHITCSRMNTTQHNIHTSTVLLNSFSTASLTQPARMYWRIMCMCTHCVLYGVMLCCAVVYEAICFVYIYIYSGFGRMRQSDPIKIHLYYYYLSTGVLSSASRIVYFSLFFNIYNFFFWRSRQY